MRKITDKICVATIYKQLQEYWSFFNYCYNWGPYPKAEWIYENRIKPLARKHPILNFIASII